MNHCARNVANIHRATGMHRMNTTTSLSLAEAAAATGMVKSSILRAIKSGRLSGARDDLGQWRIEASSALISYFVLGSVARSSALIPRI